MHRSRPDVSAFARGQKHGEVYKQREYGIGPRATVPYKPRTLEAYKVAIVNAYRCAGVPDGENPGCSKEVCATLRVVTVILGEGRGALPDVITPELARRIIGSLDVSQPRQALVAVLIAHGLTLGERASTLALRDFGECVFSDNGVLIFTPYCKNDKTQVGSRRACRASRHVRGRSTAAPCRVMTAPRTLTWTFSVRRACSCITWRC